MLYLVEEKKWIKKKEKNLKLRKRKERKDNAASIEPVTSLDKMQSGLLDWQRKTTDWDVSTQSTARKSDQSEVTISGRLANQIKGKRTNQKAGYKKKQPIDSIDTKSSLKDVKFKFYWWADSFVRMKEIN